MFTNYIKKRQKQNLNYNLSIIYQHRNHNHARQLKADGILKRHCKMSTREIRSNRFLDFEKNQPINPANFQTINRYAKPEFFNHSLRTSPLMKTNIHPRTTLASKTLFIAFLVTILANCHSETSALNSHSGQEIIVKAQSEINRGNTIDRLLAGRVKRFASKFNDFLQSEPKKSAHRQQADSAAITTLSPITIENTNPSFRSSPSTAIFKNITAQNGQSVLLHCYINSQQSSQEQIVVSWFRGYGELQLLTHENNTIIPDERFIIRHNQLGSSPSPNQEGREPSQAAQTFDWPLQIKNLDRATDAGLYQCQTNTEPPVSQYYQLNIVEPQVNILNGPDLAVRLNGPINLTCIITQSPDQLQYIFWYRDNKMINYELVNEARGKIVLSKGAGAQVRGGGPAQADTIVSNLLIHQSRLSDSGNYTCMPSGARPTSINVHILEGSDKRLSMFQSDFQQQPAPDELAPPSASSQTTNSAAISVHMVRISKTKAYAILVLLIIFTTWFQLVLQVQTAISLILLAIIGLFLGKLSDDSERRHRSARAPSGPPTIAAKKALCERRKGLLQSGSEQSSGDEDIGDDSGGSRARRAKYDRQEAVKGGRQEDQGQLNGSPGANSSASSKLSRSSSSSCSANTLDPLIKKANGALSLLQSLPTSEADERSSLSSLELVEINNLMGDQKAPRQKQAAGQSIGEQSLTTTLNPNPSLNSNSNPTDAINSQRSLRIKSHRQQHRHAHHFRRAETKLKNKTGSFNLNSINNARNTASENDENTPLSPNSIISSSSVSIGYNSELDAKSSFSSSNQSSPFSFNQQQAKSAALLAQDLDLNLNLANDYLEDKLRNGAGASCLLAGNARDQNNEPFEEEEQMIELVRQPTALSLIMDKLTNINLQDDDSEEQHEMRSKSIIGCGKRQRNSIAKINDNDDLSTTTTTLKLISLKSLVDKSEGNINHREKSGPNVNLSNIIEPHYSEPVKK